MKKIAVLVITMLLLGYLLCGCRKADSDDQDIIGESTSCGDLTLELFEQFVARNTTEGDVKRMIGEPHDYVGSGFIGSVYYTEDGYTVVVYYTALNGKEVISQIRILHDDGSYEILVQ